jgi:ribosomal protein L37E
VHEFAADGATHHTCGRCAVREPHALSQESRWEDWGGWDSIGPWSAQENVYSVCRRCGYEEFVEFTGNIRV